MIVAGLFHSRLNRAITYRRSLGGQGSHVRPNGDNTVNPDCYLVPVAADRYNVVPCLDGD